MNKPLSDSDLATPKVTTGPIAGSRKIFSVPDAAPDLRVPLREIPLSEGSGEEPVRVYDPSGPYTDNDAAIDVEKGLKRARIAWVKERGGVEEYDGRPIKPVDNGNASGTEKILREPAIGPVVTFGVARSESDSGLFIGLLSMGGYWLKPLKLKKPPRATQRIAATMMAARPE